MKLYISEATLRTIEKFGNASLKHISATPSDHMTVELDVYRADHAAEKVAGDAWKIAIDKELVTIGSTADSFGSAREAVDALINWHVSVALDPAVSESAQALIERGAALAAEKVAAEPLSTAEVVQEAARIADSFTCGTCGMDGKAAAQIRRILGDPMGSVTVHHGSAPQPAQPTQADAERYIKWVSYSGFTKEHADATLDAIQINEYAAAPQPAQPTQAATLSADQILQIAEDHDFDIDTLGTVLEEFARAILAASARQAEPFEKIARAIHYPACWDTAAYPTIESAIRETMAAHKIGCSECEHTEQTEAVRDDSLPQSAMPAWRDVVRERRRQIAEERLNARGEFYYVERKASESADEYEKRIDARVDEFKAWQRERDAAKGVK